MGEQLEYFWDIMRRGGPVMIPIAFASLLAVAIFMERLFALRRENVLPSRLLTTIHKLIGQGKHQEALEYARKSKAPIGEILVAGLENANQPRAIIKEIMEEAGKRATHKIEQFVHAVGTIATVSPLLGLLGTITGMIQVFRDVTASGVGDPGRLASGIWEALLTTAAGLIVAIPALIGYRYLMNRVDSLVLEMEEESLKVAEVLSREGGER